ncbi:TRAP transporter substrate-binding protein [Afifella sp. IM 167]|uniref:TRAP transporter substrate-binding protein n=1 Tax=Afifella sp. IM 167 TaxID=2033586 RepID=UPI001CCC5A01|nr:TRAP transporter substrate-binding protein [Afifella sp. IM 167]MBZ8133512.1 C4-dicarboxylate ABC transporter [Afifella sp. IM 167]
MKAVLSAAACAAVLALSVPAEAKTTLNMASTYPGSLTQLGTLGKAIEETIDKMSGGELEVKFFEPGALVPALEVFDAVSNGSVDAAWSTPGYWQGKEPSLALFAAVPFGPDVREYTAWLFNGGGEEMMQEIYAPYNIHSIICAVIAPEASGWFRKEINSVDDLKGLKMRFFGLGAKVMQRLGVDTQLLAGGDIYPALERGTIDATEFSQPAIDLNLGFYQVAKHYYFPGWHQQSTAFELMINKERWDGLSEQEQAMINTACRANVANGMAEGEAIQVDALAELEEKGVTIHTWPKEILDTFHSTWNEVAEEEAAKDEKFKKAWESLSTFRENYKRWGEVGYIQ